MLRVVAVMCAVAGLAIAVAACGSNSKATTQSGSSSPSSSATSPGLKKALAAVNAHKKNPTSIGPTTPIGKPIPKGKVIAYVNCEAESCIDVGKSLQAASAVLGWKYINIAAGATPASIQAGFQQAVRDNVDGVASEGFDVATYSHQLAYFKAHNIPVFSIAGTDPVGNGLDLDLDSGKGGQSASSVLLADDMIVASHGKGTLGDIQLTEYPAVAEYTAAFNKQVSTLCPKCSLKTLSLAPTTIGSTAASSIASWLTANPQINQVFVGYDPFANGLPQALKAASVTRHIDFYGQAPGAEGEAQLQSGFQTAAVPQPDPEIGWQFADGFARYFLGESLKPDMKEEPPVLWAKSFNNLPSGTENVPVVADYQAQFKKLWGMG